MHIRQKFMLTLGCWLFFAVAFAATVTIGSGTSTNAYIPINAQSAYSYSQQIVTQNQINKAGIITEISFPCSGSNLNNSNNWMVYLAHTSKNAFGSTSDWVPASSLTNVFNGTVSISSSWVRIVFNQAFNYNNSDNLLIAVQEIASGNAGGTRNFGVFSGGNNKSLYTTSNNNSINISSPGSGTRVNSQNRLQVVFDPIIKDFPYYESFDATTFPPADWKTVRTAGSGTGTWARNTGTTYAGGGSAYFNSASYASGTQGILVSPPLDLPAEGYSVSFWFYKSANTSLDKVNVYINDQDNLTGATMIGDLYRSIAQSPTVRDAGWYEYTLDFPSGSANGIKYIIIEGISARGGNLFIDDFSITNVSSNFPVANPRYVAEWEPAKGAIVTYNGSSFGQPNNLLVDLSNAGTLYVVCPSGNTTTVNNNLSRAGVNMNNVVYITAPTNSYWIRDFGPLTVFDGNDQMKMVDFNYNRPRYNDNLVNNAIRDQLGIEMFKMKYVATGGNLMTDGYGKAMSTDLVASENAHLSQEYIDAMFENYLGVDEYMLFADPLLNSTIDHIDTWGKLLDVDKVIIQKVPTNHGNYNALETAASTWANKISAYGTPYRVYRVNTSGAQGYANSFIMNKTIYVPQYGNSTYDGPALQVYRNAMPGYTVKGYTQTGTYGYLEDDALHCRVNTVFDENMIFVHHIPIQKANADSYAEIKADITSSYPLNASETYVSYRYWKNSRGSYTDWQTLPLQHVSGKEYSALVPTPSPGDSLHYAIRATDSSGRVVDRSLCWRDDPFRVPLEAVYYKSAQSGDWSSLSTWLVSTDGINWEAATEIPDDSNANSITIGDEHTVSLDTDITIKNTTIASGAELVIPSGTSLSLADGAGDDLIVAGKLTVGGNLVYLDDASLTTEIGSTIEFNGETTQGTGSGFPTEVYNLVVNNPAGLNLTNPLTVNGTLTQLQGEINGNPEPDGYSSADLNYLEFPATDEVIAGWDINMGTPELYPNRVNREWTLSGDFEGSKTLTFYWSEEDDFEFDWESDPSGPVLYIDGQKLTPTSYDTSGDLRSLTVQITGGFGNDTVFTIGRENEQTLPVELSSFTATLGHQNQVKLQWVTHSETNVLGFRIYRGLSEDLEQADLLSTFIEATNTSQMQVYVFYDSDKIAGTVNYYWLQSVDYDGSESYYGPVALDLSGLGSDAPSIPIIAGIQNIYPNPFNPSCAIKVGHKEQGHLKINVYNQKGQLVNQFVNEDKKPDNYQYTWLGQDSFGHNLPSGIYLIRMQSGKEIYTRKAVLMK